MGLRARVERQFRRPKGALGALAGWIMALRGSNRARSRWTVELLGVRPGERVLELGCGPGVALSLLAERARGGRVVGLDHSPLMLRQAARRNRGALADGVLELRQGDLAALPNLGGPFDKILSVNVVQFLGELAPAFRALHAALAPGGVIATTYQPRHRAPTRADALAMAERLRAAMAATGFEAIAVEELPLRPVPAVCVLGRRVG